MRQLMFYGPHDVRWEARPDPELDDDRAALVRPVAVATCDIDVAALRGGYPLAGPYPLGHEGVARVVAVGAGVSGVRVGQLVVVPFQISCGTCPNCLRGRTGNCAAHPPLSTYGLGQMGGLGWGGLFADLVRVPHADAMLVALPEGSDPVALASASDNIPDGWRAVGPQLAAEPGAEVLVLGGQPASIGLYAAGLAVTLGAQRVHYVDSDAGRLDIARALGAEAANVAVDELPRKVGAFPIVVDASGTERGLRCALNSVAFDGTCTSTFVYLEDPSLPMFSMYSRCCTLHTGRVHARPAIPRVLEAVARGFDPGLVTSAIVAWDDLADALRDPPMKLVAIRPG